ncbi:MAG: hypothetical protein NTU66_06085 [Elusimicrobia bacterium]|nr:hypothetical protein [Elusimicrobiota bacterium]
MSEILFTYLLKHMEGSPQAKFYESELTSISASGFAALKKQKSLLFDQYDFEHEHYYDKHGNERFVRKYNGKWIATSTEDSGISPLYLKDQDLNRYTFSVQPLINEIRSKNNLTKNINAVSPRVWYIGEKAVIQNNVGVFVAFLSDDEQAEAELLGLKAKTGKMDGALILCPSYQIKSQDLLSKMAGQNIYCLNFKEAFKKDGTIDFGKVRFNQAADQQGQQPTAQQTSDYTKYVYQCYDVLHITGAASIKRSNDLNVNGHTIKIPDSEFVTLLGFVAELKKGKGGWLVKPANTDTYRQLSRLRVCLRGSLLKKDAKKFIENDGSKKYRISTHPDFVTFDRNNLLKHSDATIKALSKRLPKDTKTKKKKRKK